MTDPNRTIEQLLVDYAGALRDGVVPEFLRSLTSQEEAAIRASRDFAHAAELVRVLNVLHFGDAAVMPEVGLFISRVDAKIASRGRKGRAAGRRAQASEVEDASERMQ